MIIVISTGYTSSLCEVFSLQDIYTGPDADDEVGEDTNSILHSALIIGHGVKYFKIKKFMGLNEVIMGWPRCEEIWFMD